MAKSSSKKKGHQASNPAEPPPQRNVPSAKEEASPPASQLAVVAPSVPLPSELGVSTVVAAGDAAASPPAAPPSTGSGVPSASVPSVESYGRLLLHKAPDILNALAPNIRALPPVILSTGFVIAFFIGRIDGDVAAAWGGAMQLLSSLLRAVKNGRE